jgi:hypothetical protein
LTDNTDLPQSEGYLAYWQLLVATTAVFNSLQNFITLDLTKRLYNRTATGEDTAPPAHDTLVI